MAECSGSQYSRILALGRQLGTVKLRRRLAEYVDDEPTAQLSRIPVSP